MMIKKESALTGFQTFAFVHRAIVGVGLLAIARTVSKVAKQDGWISVLLAGVLIYIISLLHIQLCDRFPDSNLIEIAESLIGKWGAKIVGMIYIGYFVLVSGVVSRYLSSLMTEWFLEKTPMGAIFIAILIPVIYISINGFHCLVRFCEMIFLVLLPFSILIFIGIDQIHLYNIMPVGGSGVDKIVMGIQPAIFSMSGYEVLLFIYPKIQEKKNKAKEIRKIMGYLMLFITSIYATGTFIQIAYFGYEELQYMLYTVMKLLRSFQVPVVERIELFFIFFWTAAVISTVSVYYYLGGYTVQKFFGLKRSKRALVYSVIGIAVMLIGLWPSNVRKVVELSQVVSYYNIIVGMIIPVLLLMVSYIRKKKGDGNEESEM